MKIAVVHHWFVTRGGGERVAECIASLFPSADIFTLVSGPDGTPESFTGRTLRHSFLQRIPLARRQHRHFLPLYPAAVASLDLSGYDLVLSSDSGPIKGVRTDAGATHICYCHSPMRYLWDGYAQYRAAMGAVTGTAFSLTAPWVRAWDRRAAQRVTYFLANSRYVADRIERCYRREAQVLHPPIDLQRVPDAGDEAPGEHYLCAGRLVSYKRNDVVIEACRRLGRKLRIVGSGPELAALRALAGSDPLIEFVGELSTRDLWREFAHCRALLFAADEDFGMIPLEVQACGRPVIAYGVGGSLETVRGAVGQDGRTGAYFAQQTAESVAEAMVDWEAQGEPRFRPEDARAWAATFATPLFFERYRAYVLGHVPAAEPFAAPVEEALRRIAP